MDRHVWFRFFVRSSYGPYLNSDEMQVQLELVLIFHSTAVLSTPAVALNGTAARHIKGLNGQICLVILGFQHVPFLLRFIMC